MIYEHSGFLTSAIPTKLQSWVDILLKNTMGILPIIGMTLRIRGKIIVDIKIICETLWITIMVQLGYAPNALARFKMNVSLRWNVAFVLVQFSSSLLS